MNLQNKNSNKILLSLIGGILPAIGAVIFDAMDAGQLLPYMGVGGGSIAGGVFLACKTIKKKEYSYFAFPLIYIGALLSISGLILQCGNENQKKIFFVNLSFAVAVCNYVCIRCFNFGRAACEKQKVCKMHATGVCKMCTDKE